MADYQEQVVLSPDLAAEKTQFVHDTQMGARSIKVLTQNLYLGADIFQVAKFANLGQLAMGVKSFIEDTGSIDTYARIGRIADIIIQKQPHVVGLQEVVRLALNNTDVDKSLTNPSEICVEDFLEILMEALAKQGHPYQLAGIVINADLTVPVKPFEMKKSGQIARSLHAIDRDVILVRSDVSVLDTVSASYQDTMKIPFLNSWPLNRGYVSVSVKIDGKAIRVVNTHLEVPLHSCADIQLSQAQELIRFIEHSDDPVILMGDFNAVPDSEVYQLLTAANLNDGWLSTRSELDGATCCFDASLVDNLEGLDRRIDYIFAKSGQKVKVKDTHNIERVAISEQEKTASGLYPSDHAGLFDQLLFTSVK